MYNQSNQLNQTHSRSWQHPGPMQPPQGGPYQLAPMQGQGDGGKRPPAYKPPRRFPVKPQVLIIAAAVVLVAVAVGLIVDGSIKQSRYRAVEQEIAPYEQVYGPNIFINDVPISGKTPDQALQSVKAVMDERVHSWQLDLVVDGWKYFTVNYPTLGIRYDESRLYPYLNEAWMLTHTGDAYQKREALQKLAVEPHMAYTTDQKVDGSKLDATNLDTILGQIAQTVYREPLDAALVQFRPDEKAPFVIRDEQVGKSIDVSAAKAKILEMAATGAGGTLDIPLTLVEPKVLRKDIEKQVALRAEAVTPISRSSPENRNNNIRASFAKINGYILEPGQTFSFNKVVGERTLANGFFEAIEYVKGDLVTGVGGGVCQASTTLYQAALMSELQIVKRDIHSMPVNYTERGLDATVYWTRDHEIDFKFKNTSGGRIYITAHVDSAGGKNLVSRIRFYGASMGDGVSYKLKSIVDEILQSDEIVYIPDKMHEHVLYKDETKLSQDARDGYVVSSYLQKYVNGTLVEEKFITKDQYNARPAQYWRGVMNR